MGAFWVTTPTELVYLAIWNDCRLLSPGSGPADWCGWRIAGSTVASAFTGLCGDHYQQNLFPREALAALFEHTGSVSAVALDDLADREFDLVINATSSGINGEIPLIPASLVSAHMYFYDMFYQKRKTPFLNWCEQHGAKQLADGLGMLVGQAAHAVLLWHGVLPAVEPVIEKLKQGLSA